MKIYRELVRYDLSIQLGVRPTDEQVIDCLNHVTMRRFQNMEQIDAISTNLPRFLPWYEAQGRRKKAIIAATKLWEKKRMQKQQKRRKNKRRKKLKNKKK